MDAPVARRRQVPRRGVSPGNGLQSGRKRTRREWLRIGSSIRGQPWASLMPPSDGPPVPLADPGYWVGCQATSCSSATSCVTCSCVATDVGSSWECADNDGFQPDTDAEPTPYCALNSGPL